MEDEEEVLNLKYSSGQLIQTSQLSDYQASYRWILPKPTTVDKIYSDPFDVGGTPWRALLYPRGNGTPSIAIYLDVANAHALGTGWSYDAAFTFTVVNQSDSAKDVTQAAEKTFSKGASDWGFQQFMPLSQVYGDENGFLVAEKLIVTIALTVSKGPVSEPAPAPKPTNTRNETGYVGIKNQGATCYLNSLLQSMYHISYLRNAVYYMPSYEEAGGKVSVPLALQRVFYDLQHGESSVDTEELTAAFGWDRSESFRQHDIQELLRVLAENLESKMKATEVDGTMDLLFKGVTSNVIECVNIDYESTTKETVYDIQLNVKGCKDIYDSLEQYVATEILDGENKYMAEGKGLQVARKFVALTQLPNVLMLHLKRFEYDIEKDMMYKVNDRYEFQTTISLDKYASTSHEQNHTYILLSVLVHSGTVSGGHYYAFIKPNTEDSWYRFDDEKVTKVSEEEAVEENYGGPSEQRRSIASRSGETDPAAFSRSANAYMLIYVRKTALRRILFPITYEDVPRHLRDNFEREKRKDEEEKKDAAETHLFVTVKVIDFRMLEAHKGFDLVDLSKVEEMKCRRLETFGAFTDKVHEICGIPGNQQQFWVWEERLNGTSRPSTYIQSPSSYKATIEKVFSLPHNHSKPLTLFVHNLSKMQLSPLGISAQPLSFSVRRAMSIDSTLSVATSVATESFLPFLLIFIKTYDPTTKNIATIDFRVVPYKITMQELFSFLTITHSDLHDVAFDVYEEVRAAVIEELLPTSTPEQVDLTDGDIIVFSLKKQPNQDDSSGHIYQRGKDPFSLQVPSTSTPNYFYNLLMKVNVKFCHLAKPAIATCTLELTRDMVLADVRYRLASKLGLEADKIQITGQNIERQPRKLPFRDDSAIPNRDLCLIDMLTIAWDRVSTTLYYEVMPDDVAYSQSMCIRVDWYNANHQKQYSYRVTVHRDDCIGDILIQLQSQFNVLCPKSIARPPPCPEPSSLFQPDTPVWNIEDPPIPPMPIQDRDSSYFTLDNDPPDDVVDVVNPDADSQTPHCQTTPASGSDSNHVVTDPPTAANSDSNESSNPDPKSTTTTVMSTINPTTDPNTTTMTPAEGQKPVPTKPRPLDTPATGSNASSSSQGEVQDKADQLNVSRISEASQKDVSPKTDGQTKKPFFVKPTLRLMEISNRHCRICYVFDPTEPLNALEDHPHYSLRAECIPPAQVDAVPFELRSRDERVMPETPPMGLKHFAWKRDPKEANKKWLVQVIHFSMAKPDKMRTHGVPFLTIVHSHDTVSMAKKRILEKQKEAKEWKFYAIHSRDQCVELKDDDRIFVKLLTLSTAESEACIGVEHKESGRTDGGPGISISA